MRKVKTWQTEMGIEMHIPVQAEFAKIRQILPALHTLKIDDRGLDGLYAYYEDLGKNESIAFDDKKYLEKRIGKPIRATRKRVLLKDYIENFEKVFNYLNADSIYMNDDRDRDNDNEVKRTRKRKSTPSSGTIYDRVVSVKEIKNRY